MRVSIISANGHRINEYMADMAYTAIKYAGDKDITARRQYDKDCDVVLMTNGVGFTQEALDAMADNKPIMYLHDELTAGIPIGYNVVVFSQYVNTQYKYFNVARLSIFDKEAWERAKFYVEMPKPYDFVYWGHKKPGREEFYKTLPDGSSSLYIGEWEDKKNSKVISYIRERERLIAMISLGKWTEVKGSRVDGLHFNVPLRVYEALMAGVVPRIHCINLAEPNMSYQDMLLALHLTDMDAARLDLAKNLISKLKGVYNGDYN